MDCRDTLSVNETFVELLTRLWRSNEKVHLLVDDNGIGRREEGIKNIDMKSEVIQLNDGMIELKKIVAVNGVFLPEFGEC